MSGAPDGGAGQLLTAKRPVLRSFLGEWTFWLLACLSLVYFFRALVLGSTFYFRDLLLLLLPERRLWAHFLASGQLPTWNPYVHGGMPFIADLGNAALYPSSVLYLLFSGFTAMNVEIVLHVMLASLAAYVLARVLGFERLASLVAGLVFAYCGYTLSLANLPGRLFAVPYLPLILVGWHLFLQRGRARYLAFCVVCGAVQTLAGAPEMVVLTQGTLFLWTLATYRTTPLTRRLRLLALEALLVLGLSAVQLVPTAELLSRSARGEGMTFEAWSTWSVPPSRLPELVLPHFLGPFNRFHQGSYWGRELVDNGFPYVLSIYFGCLTLGLVAASLAAGIGTTLPKTLRRLLWALLAVSLIASLGRWLPLFRLIYEHLPMLRIVRFPVKLLNAAVLPAALLAASGFEVLSRARTSLLRTAAVLCACTAALGIATAVWFRTGAAPQGASSHYFHQPVEPEVLTGLSTSFAHAGTFLLLAALILVSRRVTRRAWQPAGLVALLAVDLLVAGRDVNEVAPRALFRAPDRLVAAVRSVAADGRLYRASTPAGTAIAAETDDAYRRFSWEAQVLAEYRAWAYRIPVIFHADYNSLVSPRARTMKATIESLPWAVRLKLLSAAGVRAIITHERVPELEHVRAIQNASNIALHLYRNPDAAGPLELATSWHVASDPHDALQAMGAPDFDARRQVVLEGTQAASANNPCQDHLRVRWRDKRATLWRAELSSSCPGYLVLDQPFASGWSIRLDGRPTQILRANYLFSAVWLPPGQHTLLRRYVPKSLVLGAAISSATLLASIALLLVLSRAARRHGNGDITNGAQKPPVAR